MGRRILSCQRNKVVYRGKGHRLTMLKTTMGEVGYRRHVYLLSGEAERHVMTVYLLDKAMDLDTVGLFRYTACIMVVEAASIAQRGPAARPLWEYGEKYLHHYGNRMKHNHTCWCVIGANNLVALLALRHTGRLRRVLRGWARTYTSHHIHCPPARYILPPNII